MRTLLPHPQTGGGPVTRLEAAVEPSRHGCRARFRMLGDVQRIAIPAARAPERADDLWMATCCEIFWQPESASAYREFNLSPSTCWAAYDFGDVRCGRCEAPAEIEIVVAQQAGAFELSAEIRSELPLPAAVALTAVVEDRGGTMHYWALAFAQGKPDFHSPVGRTVHLAGRL